MNNKKFSILSRLLDSLDAFVIKNVFPLLKKFLLLIDDELDDYRILFRIIFYYIYKIWIYIYYRIHKIWRRTCYYINKIGRYIYYRICRTLIKIYFFFIYIGNYTRYYIKKIGNYTRYYINKIWIYRHYIKKIWISTRYYIGKLKRWTSWKLSILVVKLKIYWIDLKLLFQEIHVLWLYLKKKLKEKYKK